MKRLKDLGLKSDPKLYTETGMYWCPIGDDSTPQAIFFIDSYPALVTRAVDEEEDEGNALALEARSFSKYVKRITGHIRRKAIILVGVNQLRDKPMARYGPDYTEPGGNALKFFSSARNMMRPVVPPQGWDRDSENGGVCVEESVNESGGFDYYAFKSIRNIKNKHGIPFRKTMTRVWIEDSTGKARGFDPVFDAWCFYTSLGLVEGSRKKFTINLPETKGGQYTWTGFKQIILAEVDKSGALLDAATKSKVPLVQLVRMGHKMIKSGKAEELYIQARHHGVAGEVEDLED